MHVQALSLPDIDDIQVLDFAERERRVIITADTDFGGLACDSPIVVTLCRVNA